MTNRWVLDAEAVNALADSGHSSARSVANVIVTAARLRQHVVIPAVILAECQRGRKRTHGIDALLAREPALRVRDTDRSLARYVGGVLFAASAGSDDIADAHCVATVVEAGRGVIVTGDPDDMIRLSASFPQVEVEPLAD